MKQYTTVVQNLKCSIKLLDWSLIYEMSQDFGIYNKPKTVTLFKI